MLRHKRELANSELPVLLWVIEDVRARRAYVAAELHDMWPGMLANLVGITLCSISVWACLTIWFDPQGQARELSLFAGMLNVVAACSLVWGMRWPVMIIAALIRGTVLLKRMESARDRMQRSL